MKYQGDHKHTFEEALAKAKKYCAGQEHCEHDVLLKLYEWGGHDFSKTITEKLKKEGFISDKRYAELFTRSKINQNKWGRLKIEAALKMKNIPSPIIHEVMENVNEKDYLQNLKTLFLKKGTEIRETDEYAKQQKISLFLMSKGYEPELIYKLFKK
jgi:regulatory protein